MGRPLLYVPPGGAVFELTSRTLHGRYLLRPGRRLNSLLVGVLGRARRRYQVELFGAAFLSNHFHLLARVVTPEQLAGFMQYFKSNLAKEAGRLYGWRERFWGRRYRPIQVFESEDDQVQRLRYILAQACKEGLVASPLEWPGVHCARSLIQGRALEGEWFDRTAEYRARRRGDKVSAQRFATTERLLFSPLPCWSHLEPQEVREAVRQLVCEIERETAAQHQAEGTQPLGVKKILRQHPHQRPSKSHRRSAPRFHARSRVARRSMERAYTLVLTAYRRASEQLRRGCSPVTFPPGCFPPRLPRLEVPYQLVPG